MTWTRVGSIFAVTILGAISFAPLSALGQTNSADEAAVRQVLSDFVDAFNHHDAHVWAACFAEDGDFTNVSGLTRHGRKEIEERFTGLFAGPLKSAHRTFNVRHIRFIRPDVVAADADYDLTGSKAADGTENPDRKGVFIWTLTKQNGRWLFSVFHEFELVSQK
jgi:uncharacterized protein (TIGR02246 family)